MKYKLEKSVTDPLIGRLRTRQTDCLSADLQKHIKSKLFFILCDQYWEMFPRQLWHIGVDF